ITSTTVSRPLFGGLTYHAIQTLNLGIDLGPHNVNVTSLPAGTRLDICDGSIVPNTVNLGSATASLDAIQGAVAVHGGFPGLSNVLGGNLNVNDQAATAGHTYTVTATSLTRDGAASP